MERMWKRSLLLIVAWFSCSCAWGEDPNWILNDPGHIQALEHRIQQLEVETEALRTELGVIRQLPPVTPVSTTNYAAGPAMDKDPLYCGDCAWWKGDYKIVPYGSLWGNAAYDSRRTTPGAYTLYVPSTDVEGEDAFVIDTRRTRLGLDVTGPQIYMLHCFNSRARVEIDFHGAFVIENKPGVLLRHAYAELYNDDWKILAGQTWDLISPLYPHKVSYTVGWAGGNIGYRRMQIRVERYLQVTDYVKLTPAFSVNQNIVSDFATATNIDAEATDWPLVQGRLGVTLGPTGSGCDPITFGVSGHVGEQGFDFSAAPVIDDARVRTWSFNMDMRVPVGDRMGFQGEFFTGANLGTFLGGIVQGVDLTRREAIYSTGGWFELWYDWNDRLHSHVGYGLDDPRNGDVTTGRTYNEFIFANLIVDVTSKLQLGFEVTDWRTHWVGLNPGDAVRLEFSGKYNF
jgi:hypothetical protein